jgi:hypothetical protein
MTRTPTHGDGPPAGHAGSCARELPTRPVDIVDVSVVEGPAAQSKLTTATSPKVGRFLNIDSRLVEI